MSVRLEDRVQWLRRIGDGTLSAIRKSASLGGTLHSANAATSAWALAPEGIFDEESNSIRGFLNATTFFGGSKNMRTHRLLRRCFAGTLLLVASFAGAQQTPLYGPNGVAPAAVVQGTLGSCFFHATVAAISVRHADLLRNSITDLGSGSYRVSFRNGPAETVQLEDILYARQNGFDRSDGLWVAVLLRGLGQRTVRESLTASLTASDLPAPARSMAESLLSANDALLLAYDRAIRASISQSGSIARDTLKARLKEKTAALSIPSFLSSPVIDALDSAGFFDTLSKKIQERGELFGAYRSVGNGGLPTAVIEAFYAPSHSVNLKSPGQAREHLLQDARTGTPLVAIALGGLDNDVLERVHTRNGKPDWYVANHAYTVVSFDESADRATIRNPWGHEPSPDGLFTISVDDLVKAFPVLAEAE